MGNASVYAHLHAVSLIEGLGQCMRLYASTKVRLAECAN